VRTQGRTIAGAREGIALALDERMARTLLLTILVVASACHRPSLTGGVKSLGASVGRVGGSLAAVVKPVTTAVKPVTAQVDPDVAAALVAAAAEDQARRQEPITVEHRSSHHQQAPAPAPAPNVTVTEHRTVAPPPVFLLHGTTRNGRHTCTQYTSQDECVSSCTSTLKQAAWSKDPDAMQSCNCIEGKGC